MIGSVTVLGRLELVLVSYGLPKISNNSNHQKRFALAALGVGIRRFRLHVRNSMKRNQEFTLVRFQSAPYAR